MGQLSHHPFSTSLEEELWAPNCSNHSSLLTSTPTLSLIRHNLLPTEQPECPSCKVSYIMSLPHSLSLSVSQHTWNPTPHPYHGPLGSPGPVLHKGSTLPSPLSTRHPAPCCSLSTWTTCWPQAVSISWPLCLETLPSNTHSAHPPLTSFSSQSPTPQGFPCSPHLQKHLHHFLAFCLTFYFLEVSNITSHLFIMDHCSSPLE